LSIFTKLTNTYSSGKFVHRWSRVIGISNPRTLATLLRSDLSLSLSVHWWMLSELPFPETRQCMNSAWIWFRSVDHMNLNLLTQERERICFLEFITSGHSCIIIAKPWLVLWWCLMMHQGTERDKVRFMVLERGPWAFLQGVRQLLRSLVWDSSTQGLVVAAAIRITERVSMLTDLRNRLAVLNGQVCAAVIMPCSRAFASI
jgi:hypothetical protein